MWHKVKEIFQKLYPVKEAPLVEAPYKVEPSIDSLSVSTQQEVKEEVKPPVVEEPAKVTKPKKPKTNQNGNKPKQRKNK